MAVPDFQSMFVPFLKIVSDGKDHTTKEIIESMAQHFELSMKIARKCFPAATNDGSTTESVGLEPI